ncbi:MAG: hypothetical protein QXL47_03710 [Candidatus Anstonellales archaeon]
MQKHTKSHSLGKKPGMMGSLFPMLEPLREECKKKDEERKKLNIGFWKQIILYRNKELMDEYKEYVKDEKIWFYLKEVWEEFTATYEDRFEYNKPIEKKRWRFLFELLEYEERNDYERLKKSWRHLGDFRKTIIFACGAGKVKHPHFLSWVVWERLDNVKRKENDANPWIIINSTISLFRIAMSDERCQMDVRLAVESRIRQKAKDIKETGMFASPYLKYAVASSIHEAFLGYLIDLCFQREDMGKLMKRMDPNFTYEENKAVRRWIEENKEFIKEIINTALQHTQDA